MRSGGSPVAHIFRSSANLGPVKPMPTLDRNRLKSLMEREQKRFVDERPKSKAVYERGKNSLLSGVPMNWMVKWAGAFPPVVREAQGAHFFDLDGHRYVDLCLGDTGAMTGHSPALTVAAVREQAGLGLTLMLPTEASIWVGEELQRRFGLKYWQFTLTATDNPGGWGVANTYYKIDGGAQATYTATVTVPAPSYASVVHTMTYWSVDRAGNAGPTVWWNGRVVGAWAQLADGEIVWRLIEDVGREAVAAIGREASRLQAWLGATRFTPRFGPRWVSD